MEKEWGEAGSYFAGAGGGVFGQGNYAEGHDCFLTEHLVESAACAGEGSGDGGMGVNDGGDIFAVVVDGEVHAELAGDFSGAGELPALEIDDDHVV